MLLCEDQRRGEGRGREGRDEGRGGEGWGREGRSVNCVLVIGKASEFHNPGHYRESYIPFSDEVWG